MKVSNQKIHVAMVKNDLKQGQSFDSCSSCITSNTDLSSSSSPLLDNKIDDNEQELREAEDPTQYNFHYDSEEEIFLMNMKRKPAMSRILKRELHRGERKGMIKAGRKEGNKNQNKSKSKKKSNNTDASNQTKNKMSKSKYKKKAQRAIKEEHMFILDDEEIDYISCSFTSSKSNKVSNSRSRNSKTNNSKSSNKNNSNKNNDDSKEPRYEDEGDFLTASELGIEDEEMYERLLSIFEGDDISPEDYDVLLELDKNNVRKTLDEKEISSYPIIIVEDDDNFDNANNKGNGPEHASKIDKSSWKCDICLES